MVKSFMTLAPGGSMGPGYVPQLFNNKSHAIVHNSRTNEAK